MAQKKRVRRNNNHHHHHAVNEKNLLAATLLNLVITVVEIAGGLLSGSLALLSDAFHNLSDPDCNECLPVKRGLAQVAKPGSNQLHDYARGGNDRIACQYLCNAHPPERCR